MPFPSHPPSQVLAGCTRGLCSLLLSLAISSRQRGLLTTSPAPATFARPHQSSMEPQGYRVSSVSPGSPATHSACPQTPPHRHQLPTERLPRTWLKGLHLHGSLSFEAYGPTLAHADWIQDQGLNQRQTPCGQADGEPVRQPGNTSRLVLNMSWVPRTPLHMSLILTAIL